MIKKYLLILIAIISYSNTFGNTTFKSEFNQPNLINSVKVKGECKEINGDIRYRYRFELDFCQLSLRVPSKGAKSDFKVYITPDSGNTWVDLGKATYLYTTSMNGTLATTSNVFEIDYYTNAIFNPGNWRITVLASTVIAPPSLDSSTDSCPNGSDEFRMPAPVGNCLEACSLNAPTGLKVNKNFVLSWNKVPGAVSYKLSSPTTQIFTDCCSRGTTSVSMSNITRTKNKLKIPLWMRKYCFTWQVVAVCSDGSMSPPAISCYTPPRSNEIIWSGNKRLNDSYISLYPNPNKGEDMSVNIKLKNDAKLSLSIYNFNGSLVKAIKNLETKKGILNVDLRTNLPKGKYIFKLITNDGETRSKTIIVK